MAGSVNKIIIIGNLGNDPKITTMNNGNRVCNLSVATSEDWKNKATGERQSRTEWHRIVIWNDGLVNIAEKYLKKGSKVYLEGSLQTKKYNKDGVDVYSTEIVLKNFNGTLTMLDSRNDSPEKTNDQGQKFGEHLPKAEDIADGAMPEDEIPF